VGDDLAFEGSLVVEVEVLQASAANIATADRDEDHRRPGKVSRAVGWV
jgi:hypothetical protein